MRAARLVGLVGAGVLALGLGWVPAGAHAADPGKVTDDPLASVTYQHDPAHDGVSDDPGFSAALVRSWSRSFDGEVSYPVIADRRVFVTVSHAQGYGDDVEALSLDTGDVLWGPVSIGGTYWAGMLAHDGGRVFSVTFDGSVSAFDAATGEREWTRQMPGQSAFTSAPTATGGTLYVAGAGSGGTLYAVDEATGDVRWTAPVDGGSSSSPAVDDGGVVVSYSCEQVYRFTTDGTLDWHHDADCSGGGGRTAVVHAGRVYVRDDAGRMPVVLDEGTGSELGAFDSRTAPAVDDERLVTTVGGTLRALDPATGSLAWMAPQTDHVTAPLIVDGAVVTGRSAGVVELRDERDGRLLWNDRVPVGLEAPDEHNATKLVGPAEGDGTLVVPAGSTLTAFRPTSVVAVIDAPPRVTPVSGEQVDLSFWSPTRDASFTCTLDGVSAPCTSPVDYRDLGDGRHRFTVTQDGVADGGSSRSFVVDATAPDVLLHRWTSKDADPSRVTVRWAATDARSSVATYRLRWRSAPLDQRAGAWALGDPTTARSATLRLPRGTRLCAQVRATDSVGNESSWTAARCVVRR